METTLLVAPHVSQTTPGALAHNNDCGAACMSMLLKAFNLANDMTVDELFDLVNPSSDVGLGGPDIVDKLHGLELNTSWTVFSSQASLFGTLQTSKPVIALIHYEPLVKNGYTQFKNYKKGHYVLVVGMDIARIFIQDPNRDDGVKVTSVPIEVFWEAWGQCSLDDGNPNFMGIVPATSIMDLSNGQQPEGAGRYVLTVNGIYVHADPSESSPKVPPTVIWKVANGVQTLVTITKVENGYGHRLEGGWVSMDLLKPAPVQ
jgi:hypothetical protein